MVKKQSKIFYDISLLKTNKLLALTLTRHPFLFRVYTGVVALAFALTSFCFLVYERLVTKREKTKTAALHVVASLFPSEVQDKVLKGVQDGVKGTGTPQDGSQIASFFPDTTVLFGRLHYLQLCGS